MSRGPTTLQPAPPLFFAGAPKISPKLELEGLKLGFEGQTENTLSTFSLQLIKFLVCRDGIRRKIADEEREGENANDRRERETKKFDN